MSAGPYRNQLIHWLPKGSTRTGCDESYMRRRVALDEPSIGANPPLTRADVTCPGCLAAMAKADRES